MLEESTIELLDTGCALIVGLVRPDGAPLATRAWGVALLDGATAVRFLVETAVLEAALLDAADLGARDITVALTACSVPRLDSVQLKGTLRRVDAITDADRAMTERYTKLLFDDIERTDGTPRVLLEHMRPGPLAACEMTIDATFNQTPGPLAGSRLDAGS